MSRMARAWISVSSSCVMRAARRVGTLGLADEADHEVEMLDGLAQAGQDVGALLGAREVVARPARHDLAAELHERFSICLRLTI